MQEVDGSTPFRGTYPNDFSDRKDQDIRTQCALSWKRAVSECSVTECWQWHPLYQTGKGVHVPANTLQTRRRRTHSTGCVRPWFRTAKPLRIDWD